MFVLKGLATINSIFSYKFLDLNKNSIGFFGSYVNSLKVFPISFILSKSFYNSAISCYNTATLLPSADLNLSIIPAYSALTSLSITSLTYLISSVLYSIL